MDKVDEVSCSKYLILHLAVYKKRPEDIEDKNEQWATEERVQRLVANATLQRTWIWFPTPMSKSSLVTLAPKHMLPFARLSRHLHSCAYTHAWKDM